MSNAKVEDMEAYLSERKEKIGGFLEEALSSSGVSLDAVHPMGRELCEKLLDFAIKGKMLRGALAGLGFELYAPPRDEVTIPLGSVQELFQSALLIHDDIMDKDLARRGSPSLLGQYVAFAEGRTLNEPYHTGESLSICAGDVAFFLGFEMLSRVPLEIHQKSKLLSLCAQELTRVVVAQMVDVTWGADTGAVSIDQIINMYTYKTARYTYALPLVAGAIAANAADKDISDLESLGTHMGVLFQIKDDELGIFGNPEKTGKPVGSDIREGKKTLYHHFLMKDPDRGMRDRVRSLFGKGELTTADVEFVRKRIEELGVREQIDEITGQIADKAKQKIATLGGNERAGDLLSGMLSYNSVRAK